MARGALVGCAASALAVVMGADPGIRGLAVDRSCRRGFVLVVFKV